MVSFNRALVKNIWYSIHGLFWQIGMSCLACYNIKSKSTELQERLGAAYGTFVGLYFLCLLSPLIKLNHMCRMWSGLDAGSGYLWRTLVLTSRTSSLLAFDAATRTQKIFGHGQSKLEIRMRRRFVLQFPEEAERAGLVMPPADLERKCCRENPDRIRKQRGCLKRMAESPKAFWCMLSCYLLNPQPYAMPNPALPIRVFWSLKLSLWSCIFHLLIYFSSVGDGVIQWYDITWLAKALMSLAHLNSLRRASTLRSPWPLEWSGVITQDKSRWPVADLWQAWSRAASEAFAWDENLDWWKLLQPSEIVDAYIQLDPSAASIDDIAT